MKIEVGKTYYDPVLKMDVKISRYKEIGKNDCYHFVAITSAGDSCCYSHYGKRFMEDYYLQEIKPQVGEFWEVRGYASNKCRVICNDKKGYGKPFVILICHDEWENVYFTSIESFVKKWVDKPEVDWDAMPKWANFVFKNNGNGVWWCTKHEPFEEGKNWASVATGCQWIQIPDEYAPKFNGDWKDSLVERPKK